MHLGIAHHLGWAVAVTASPAHQVVDRRRIDLVEPGLPVAPVHHEGGAHPMHRSGELLDDAALEALVAQVRDSSIRMTSYALDEIQGRLHEPIVSISLRSWPTDFPDDIATRRRPPYESAADSIMYRQVLADEAERRGWTVDLYDGKEVEARARELLADRAHEVLDGPRSRLGPPWNKDHRIALAATVLLSA